MPVAQRPMKKHRHHPDAIEAFKTWCKQNPKASRERRISQFDAFVDSALLKVEIDRSKS